MKSIVISFALLFSLTGVYAQHAEGSLKIHNEWKGKTLIIVQYPNSDVYNQAAVAVAKRRWYNDKVKLVDYADRSEYLKEKGVVFLSIKGWFTYLGVPVITLSTTLKAKNHSSFYYGKEGWAYTYIQSDYELNLRWKEWFKEWEKDESRIVKNREIARGLEVMRNTTIERMELVIEMMFNSTDQFKNGDYEFKAPKKHSQLYNTPKNIQILKTKTLLIEEKNLARTEKDLSLLELENIKKYYKGKVKIVSEKELKEAILNKDPNALYLHVKEEVRWPTYSIVDLSDRRIIYCGQQVSLKGFAPELFTKMLADISHAHR